MERLTIYIPESKSAEIKSYLKSMGVEIVEPKKLDMDAYRKKIANISAWSDEDIKAIEEGRKAFNSLKPQEW